MKRTIGAAVAAIALGFAGQASAATNVFIDFEDGTAGTPIEHLMLAFAGSVVDDGSNKYLLLTPPAHEVYDPTLFALWGTKWFDAQGNKLGIVQTLESFDIYASAPGYIRPKAGPLIEIQAGWQTLTGAGCDGNHCQFFIHAPGARLDNIRFSYDTVAVPEPATWAMMIIGFGAVGSMVRRRKLAAVAA